MIRKNLRFALLGVAIAVSNFTFAQLFIDNAQFYIQSGATVTVQGDVTSNVDIQGPGKIILKGSANQNVSMSGSNIPNLEMDNVANATLTTSAKISDSLRFTNGSIQLGNYNLTLGSTAPILAASSAKFVVTNGTGKLIKNALGATAFTYPVGNSLTTYNPVSISNSGTVDSIGVRCLANVLSTGLSGTAFTKEVVDASWDISEAVAGGSNLSVTANWATSDQLTGFNIAKPTGLSYYMTTPAASVGWDLLNSQTAVAVAGTPNYSVTRTGISSLGTFAVGQRPVLSPLLIAPKVFLQGCYNTSTLVMNDALRSLVAFPTTEPYTGMTGFTHSGSGGGETTTAAVLAVTGNNAIVDWVFVQLHKASDSSIVSTRAALLQRNGTIVEPDGVTPLSMAGNAPGSYFISVRHRNHLGVRTAASLNLSAAKITSQGYDFTTALSKAYTKGITNAQMATLSSGVYGMWSGNANDDIAVKMTGLNAGNNDYLKLLNTLGSSTTTIPNTYSKQDLNMDGTVKMTGLNSSNNDYLKLLNSIGSSTTTVTQPTF